MKLLWASLEWSGTYAKAYIMNFAGAGARARLVVSNLGAQVYLSKFRFDCGEVTWSEE